MSDTTVEDCWYCEEKRECTTGEDYLPCCQECELKKEPYDDEPNAFQEAMEDHRCTEMRAISSSYYQ